MLLPLPLALVAFLLLAAQLLPLLLLTTFLVQRPFAQLAVPLAQLPFPVLLTFETIRPPFRLLLLAEQPLALFNPKLVRQSLLLPLLLLQPAFPVL